MMTPEIMYGKNVIVQGITGRNGQRHTRAMLDYGTHIVAGTSPGKAGEMVEGAPVYSTVADIQRDHRIDASVLFVPAKFAKAAIYEATDAGVPLIICITENIPVHDMLEIKQYLKGKSSSLIGPNCPGVLVPGIHNLGIIPARIATPGSAALVSRSGTLTYEAMDLLTRAGIGQRYIIGIGGDMIPGSDFIDCLQLFENDPEVSQIVMIGEIGGTSEIEAADYIAKSVTKPVYGYVAGHSAPEGVHLGHAGAILGTNQLESARAKTDYLAARGVVVDSSLANLISKIR